MGYIISYSLENIQFRDGEKNVHRCSKTIQLINKWKSFARLLFILPFFPNPLVVAIVERLEPKAEKKFPKVSISSLLRLLEIATERSPARATSSQPERVDKKEEIERLSKELEKADIFIKNIQYTLKKKKKCMS